MIPQYLSAIWAAIARPMANHLWQSTVFLAAAWLLTLALRKNQARVRYWLWLAASIKFLIPFALLISLGSSLSRPGNAAIAQSGFYSTVEEISLPFTQTVTPIVPPVSRTQHFAYFSLLPELLLAAWLIGFAAVLSLWWLRWRRISAAMRSALPMSRGREVDALRQLEQMSRIRKPIPSLLSRDSLEPGIFGIVRPVLLWPAGISKHLDDAHLRAILAHEVWHVRRRDNLAAAIHMIVEAVFWFHPLVWWLGARLVEERERACDEEVLRLGNQAQTYAEGILKTCEFCVGSPLACVSGVTGADLKQRIVRIMTVRLGTELSLARKVLLAGVIAVIVAGPLGLGLLRAMQANAPLLHPADTTRPEFEVATIKPSKEVGQSLGYHLSPVGFEARHASLKDLIMFAYVMKSNDQLVDAPKWSNSEFFDIQAKYSDADIQAAKQFPMDEQMNNLRLRVQSLLAERFQLKTRVETRELPVYALVVDKEGIKMKEVEADPPPAPGTPPQPNAHIPQINQTAPNQFTATAWPVNEMTVWLSRFEELGGRIVVNETGLTGHYDWVLNGVSSRLQQPDASGSAAQEPVASIFTALPEQLGLKLEPRKALVEVLVIDHVEQPSPN